MTLTKKQKVLSVATAVIFLLIIWQVYDMFSTPTVKTTSPPSTMPTSVIPPSGVAVSPVPQPKPASTDKGEIPADQQAYLQLASEYQLIQMQRMIAEGYAAIATARLNAAKALAELSKYNADTAAAGLPGMSMEGKGGYELVYLGQQGGEWAATLKKGSQTYDVIAGTVLGGNSRVLQVDAEGVTVKRDRKKVLITFNGEVPVTAKEKALEEEAIEPDSTEVEEEPVVEAPKKKSPVPVPLPEVKKPVAAPQPVVAEEKKPVPAPVAPVPAPKPAPVAEVKPAPAPAPAAPKPAAVTEVKPLSAASMPALPELKKPVPAPAPVVPVAAPKPAPVAEVKSAPAPAPAAPKPAAVTEVKPLPAASVLALPALKKPAPVAESKPKSPVPTAAERADFQQLQALLPADQAKKINGNGASKPAVAMPALPEKPAPVASAPAAVVSPKPVVAEAKPSSYHVAIPAKPVIPAKPTPPAVAPAQAAPVPAVASVPAAATPPASPVPPSAVSSSGASSEQRLLALKPATYTIQVLASAESDNLVQFIKQHQLGDKAVWYRTIRDGKNWYVLIYGEYADMPSAKKALSQLSGSIQAWTPFIRQMSSVQTAIKRNPAYASVGAAASVAPTVEKPVEKVPAAEKPTGPAAPLKPAAVTPPVAPLPPAAPVVTKVAKEPVAKEPTYPSSDKHLLAAASSAYTVQLTASPDLPTLFALIQANKLDKKAMWYRTTRDGKDWYVLIYGEYADMDAAKKAIADLPKMPTSTPFIRQISSVQAAIKRK